MQTSVTEQGLPQAGVSADSGFGNVASKVAETDLPFGRFVCLGTDKDKQAKLPAAAADITTFVKTLGVVMHSHAMESSLDGLPRYLAGSLANVKTKGRVFVAPEQDVSPSDPVYVRFAARKERWTIVLSGDLITGNTIAGDLNGTPISVPFNTNHATTMADLESAVEAVAGVLSATVGGTGNRTLTIVANADTELTIGTFTVTGGASQATAVTTKVAYMSTASEAGRFCKDASLDESAAATAAILASAEYRSTAVADASAVLEL
jgi:hypothetical protein